MTSLNQPHEQVFLTQYMALCDSAITAASLHRCPAAITVGVFVVILCPLSFLIMSYLKVRQGVEKGELAYVENSTPSFLEMKV